MLGAILREQGVSIQQSLEPEPSLRSSDVAIAVWMDATDVEAQTWAAMHETMPEWRGVVEHVRSGGTAVVLEMPSDFDEASLAVAEEGVRVSPMGSELVLRVSAPPTDRSWSWMEEDFDTGRRPALWKWTDERDSASPLASIERLGDGRVLFVRPAIGATNRFIDRLDNAEVFARMLAAPADTGKRLVFVESTFGNVRAKSLAAELGSWVEAARWQALLLAIVMAYSLGRRFGLPETSIRRQRGARELLDAVADTMSRAKRTDLALRLLLDHVDHRLRRTLNLSPEASAKDRNARLPEKLVRVLQEAQAAMPAAVGPREAHRISTRLLAELRAFEEGAKASGLRTP